MSIRLRYTGLINFGTNVLSLITGLVFSVIVARSLSQTDIGLWYFIDTNITMFALLKGLIPFWLTRSYARGREIASSGIVANIVLALPFFLGYILILPFFENVWLSPLHFGFASSFIFLHYTLSSITALVNAKRPEKIGYALILGEIFKLVSYPLIINYQLLGVITATAFSHIAKIVYLFTLIEHSWKLDFKQIKVWIRSSWVLIIGIIGVTSLQNLHKYFLGLYSIELLAVYSIYNMITSKITISNSLASGLYPRLLSGEGKGEDVESVLSLTLMFAIPMTLGGIILARDLISILGSKYLYVDMANVTLYLMFIVSFIKVLENIFRGILLGLEQVDVGIFDQKSVLKSRIFVNNIIPYSGVLIATPLLFVLIPVFGLISVASVQVVIAILLCLLRYIFARKSIDFDFPVRRIIKYCIAASIMVFILLFLPRGRGSIVVVLEVLFGFLIYISSLWLIDTDTRELVSNVISEVRSLAYKKNLG